MLFTSIQEINSIYPTSRWDDLDSLLNPLNKVERTKLVKYLGTPLLKRLNVDYSLLLDTQGGILAQHTDYSDNTTAGYSDYSTADYYSPVLSGSAADPSATVPDSSAVGQSATVLSGSAAEPTSAADHPILTTDILHACQEVILYFMLSDNIRILSSSLNRGGGFNSMSADDYDQSSDKQLDALKRETWHQALSSVDNLLRLLEQDAKEDRIYTDLWKHSHYYYQQSDLLFTTAEDLNHYLDIQDSREQYITLTSVIRNAQDNYLAGRLGEDLLEDLISGTVIVSSAYESDYEHLRPRLYKHLKQALANYVASSSDYISQHSYKDNSIKQANQASTQAHSNGDMQLALASRIVILHPDVFEHYISHSLTLQSLYLTETGTAWKSPSDATTSATVLSGSAADSTCPLSSDLSARSYSSLTDLGGLHLN